MSLDPYQGKTTVYQRQAKPNLAREAHAINILPDFEFLFVIGSTLGINCDERKTNLLSTKQIFKKPVFEDL